MQAARGAIFEALTEIAGDGTLRGDIAQSWETNDGGKTWSSKTDEAPPVVLEEGGWDGESVSSWREWGALHLEQLQGASNQLGFNVTSSILNSWNLFQHQHGRKGWSRAEMAAKYRKQRSLNGFPH